MELKKKKLKKSGSMPRQFSNPREPRGGGVEEATVTGNELQSHRIAALTGDSVPSFG